jgi:hypothetical protein
VAIPERVVNPAPRVIECAGYFTRIDVGPLSVQSKPIIRPAQYFLDAQWAGQTEIECKVVGPA